MTPTEAAELWTRIENELLKRGMLREGRELRENRASLVRLVGDTQPPPDLSTEKAARFVVDEAEAVTDILLQLPRPMRKLADEVVRGPPSPPDADITRMLDRYLDRSIHGYDQDDEVPYR